MDHAQLERGNTVTCRLVGGHRSFITRGRRYEVLTVDTQLRRLFIQADDGQRRWFEWSLFETGDEPVVTLAEVRIDDQIDDPRNDVVGVTVVLSDRSERVCFFATSDWIDDHLRLHTEPKVKQRGALRLGQLTMLAQWIQGADGKPFAVINTPNLLIVSRITEAVIRETLTHLDDQDALLASTLPCPAI